LYERLPQAGVARVAGILPNGDVPEFGAVLGTRPYGNESAEQPNSEARNAVSRDGSHIIFSAFTSAGSEGVRDLFARIDGDHTVAISESQRSTAGAAATLPALFQDANAKHVEQPVGRRQHGWSSS
jgi:hypothetical protein